ncbi:hypothetical protein [Aeromicrobium endophyticum]|uniref:Uncharacterized protein n=1 Tax=Aeromicrobium endophyticum TaxID=2292704 RepID=A0A371PCH8_9ACTN|nr:hypothetical protein [Aeromicrobium endophyticum]REK73632.1 hypothetical protein DX116_08890 [Aeromicrobium endophyticum]
MDLGDGVDRDANGYAYKDGITSRVGRHQRVLNESWPQRDPDGSRHARNVHPAKRGDGTPWTIDVEVRLEFDVDGVVVLPGRAERWTKTHVYVVVDDPRVPWAHVWVSAGDVSRAADGDGSTAR